MELQRAKNILRNFVSYYRFNEKKTFTEQELAEAIEYFAFEDLVHRKKIENKVEEQIKEANEILEKEEYIDNFNGSKENQKYYFDGYKDATLFIKDLLEEK